MDNAQKAIMIGVGLFITIIIIAAVMLITGMGQNLLNKGTEQVQGISESLMNDLVAQYDGKKMSGAQVRTAGVQLLNKNDSTISVYIGGDAASNKVTSTDGVNSATRGKDTTTFTGTVTNTGSSIKVVFK